MNKIFYNPNTLEIKGASNGEVSMEFPFFETDAPIDILNAFSVILENDEPVLKVKMQYTNKEWEEII